MELPEPLFEALLYEPKLCLVCGKSKAETVLRNHERDVCPICKKCSTNWNFYGYNILKKIKPSKLLWNIYLYKLFHWKPSVFTIYKDIKSFLKWSKHMKKFKNMI